MAKTLKEIDNELRELRDEKRRVQALRESNAAQRKMLITQRSDARKGLTECRKDIREHMKHLPKLMATDTANLLPGEVKEFKDNLILAVTDLNDDLDSFFDAKKQLSELP